MPILTTESIEEIKEKSRRGWRLCYEKDAELKKLRQEKFALREALAALHKQGELPAWIAPHVEKLLEQIK